jgi:exodeoxyribonuclease V gamma subunit
VLHIHFSNRYEVLAAQWLRQMGAPAAGGMAALFEPRQVVVPSLALRRALTLELARSEGVCAQVRFEFLAPWLWSRLAGPGPRSSPFAAVTLVWRVYAAFCDAGFVAAHPRLASYLQGADALMPFELAGRVAGLLEQYTSYRADGLKAWSADAAWPGLADHADAAWQAALWRRVTLGLTDEPGAQPFLETLDQATAVRKAALAQPAHVFALPTMPPMHLQWLQALAQYADIHIYALNPCQEHWFDLVDTRRLAQLQLQLQWQAHGRDQGFEIGNSLLSRWGQQTQAQLDALVNAAGTQASEDALFLPAAGQSLLAQLQNAVLDLREPAPGSLLLDSGDRSLEVHICHSMTRQLEVLHDHLLGLFAQAEAGHNSLQPLQPGRVLVAVPDLDAAAPLIDAVFGTAPPARRLPYVMTGHAPTGAQDAARALLDLLALAGSRWAASDVYALLQQPGVARRFGLLQGSDDKGLQQVRDWLGPAGIRWGQDAAHRGRLGLPATANNSWREGLARLFLGYALPSSDDASEAGEDSAPPWAGLLPAGGAEGLGAQALGGLWAFVQALSELQAETAEPLSPADWSALLPGLLPRFLQTEAGDASGDEKLLALQAHITALARAWQATGLATPLPLAVVRAALAQQLQATAPGGVPGGAITFAAMASLRGLPFDVVCVLGLDDGAWPSGARPAEFDLIAAAPRRGDRQRRSEDRNVFLDLMLAARRSLWLAYTGRSLRDNSALPPSVLVSELLDNVLPGLPLPPAKARSRLVIEHPLQAFARAPFDPRSDLRLRSHDTELAAALQARLARPAGVLAKAPGETDSDNEEEAEEDRPVAERQPLFFTTPLAPVSEPQRQLSLPDLLQFFRHPSRTLLKERLGIRLTETEDALLDDEAFIVDRSAQRALAALVLPALLQDADPEAALVTALVTARASPDWPPGPLGAAALQAEVLALQQFAQRVRAARMGPELPPLTAQLETRLEGDAWLLTGTLKSLRAQGQVRWRAFPAPATGPDLLDAWLHHLLLCLGLQQSGHLDAPRQAAPQTTWLASDRDWVFQAVADPEAELVNLLALYAQGQRWPLHFYPRTSWMQAQRPGSPSAVRGVWTASRHKPFADGADAFNRLALRGVAEPLDEAFGQQAEAVFGPLSQHLQESAIDEAADDSA